MALAEMTWTLMMLAIVAMLIPPALDLGIALLQSMQAVTDKLNEVQCYQHPHPQDCSQKSDW